MYFTYFAIYRQLASQLSGLPREAPCYGTATTNNSCPLDTTTILQRLSSQNKVLPSWTLPSYRLATYVISNYASLAQNLGLFEKCCFIRICNYVASKSPSDETDRH